MCGSWLTIEDAIEILKIESIVGTLKDSVGNEIEIALKNYLEHEDTAALEYLLEEEIFKKDLYNAISTDRSIDSLKRIFDCINAEQKNSIIYLDKKHFGTIAALAEYFSLGTSYYLNHKQLASIIDEWPDPTLSECTLIFGESYIDVKSNALGIDLYTQKGVYKKGEDFVTITHELEYMSAFQWQDKGCMLSELNRLFPDKTLYEIFDVDPKKIL